MFIAEPIEKPRPTAPYWEILLVMGLSLALALISPALKLPAILLPIVYMIVEGRLRRRAWAEQGFNLRAVPAGLKATWGLVLLVGLGTQVLAVLSGRFLVPGYMEHVISRLPLNLNAAWPGLVISLGISTLGEEVLYRALFQKRLSEFLSLPAAIGLSSLVFALMHYSAGPLGVVVVDLALIVVDSIIYGLIYARSNNVFVSWIAHFLADVVGLALLVAMM